ncbi:MAG: ABC transporter permease [Oscillochloridaceae bacterium umkhey_bin13]
MNPQRISFLLGRELVQGPKQFIFIFAVLMPLVLSFALSLIFGTIFAGKPRLGISDPGDSQLTQVALADPALQVRQYPDEAALRAATEIGVVDMGILLPINFDNQLAAGQPTTLVAFVWGESPVGDRASVAVSLTGWLRELAGQTSPVAVSTSIIGAEVVLPWQDRLLPLIVLMSIIFGAIMLPASSLVGEKQQRTLTALSVTPTTMGEIYMAKGLLGVLISTATAMMILTLNRALGNSTPLLLMVLLLGAIFAAAIGVLIGILVKDINSLFATIKGLGIFLYAPALIYMFPEIPQWLGRIFPTYYLIQPVIAITQRGAGFGEIAGELAILLLLIGIAMGAIAWLTQRMRRIA